jgi:hypothetical protein
MSDATPQLTIRLDVRRKLIPLEVFAVLHGLRLRDALGLVDDQKLWPCFNLSIFTRRNRKVHLFRGSFESYEPGRMSARSNLEAVIAAILPPLGVAPPASATIRGAELQFRWCCSNKQIFLLMKEGELVEVGRRQNSQNDSPRISYASAAAFLERRLL